MQVWENPQYTDITFRDRGSSQLHREGMTPGQQLVGTLAFSASALLLSRAQRLGEASFLSVGTEVTETDICEHFLHAQPTRGLPGNRRQGLLPA